METALYEMANLFPKHTGLPFLVWLSCRGGAQHEIQVKASHSANSEMISVAIRPRIHVVEGEMDSSDLALLAKWIEINRDVLLKYWDGEIDTKDALDALHRI
jgi:hypothetical protein